MLVSIDPQQIVNYCSLQELAELEQAIERQRTYLKNYLRKHPPYTGETRIEYVQRMLLCDQLNSLVFFKAVYEMGELEKVTATPHRPAWNPN